MGIVTTQTGVAFCLNLPGPEIQPFGVAQAKTQPKPDSDSEIGAIWLLEA
jgi:hypothetical protein